MIKLLYRCRNCGHEHNVVVPNAKVIMRAVYLNEDYAKQYMLTAHTCSENTTGICDLVGFKVVKGDQT